MQEERFRKALDCLGDAARTRIVLVSRADRGALTEAARTAGELAELGLSNQVLAINGRFHASGKGDRIATALERDQEALLADPPAALSRLARAEYPLLPFDLVGLPALRAMFAGVAAISPPGQVSGQISGQVSGPASDKTETPLPGLATLVDDLAASGRGLIMVMGKGGVGKTTVAAAIAIGLVERGHAVHLTTTDPAAHLAFVVDGSLPGLKVDSIDPQAETARYIDKIMASKGRDLDAEGKALLREDLASPCTEEVAVFHAFSRIVAEARDGFVVIDTAPTGHTLLLLDATGAYHRQMTRHLENKAAGHLTTPLMRLQNPDYTRILLVSLPERTPVSEAAALQEDLRRAHIEPHGWVVNRAMTGTETTDPLLLARKAGEAAQIARVRDGLAKRAYLVAYQPEPPVGIAELKRLTAKD